MSVIISWLPVMRGQFGGRSTPREEISGAHQTRISSKREITASALFLRAEHIEQVGTKVFVLNRAWMVVFLAKFLHVAYRVGADLSVDL